MVLGYLLPRYIAQWCLLEMVLQIEVLWSNLNYQDFWGLN